MTWRSRRGSIYCLLLWMTKRGITRAKQCVFCAATTPYLIVGRTSAWARNNMIRKCASLANAPTIIRKPAWGRFQGSCEGASPVYCIILWSTTTAVLFLLFFFLAWGTVRGLSLQSDRRLSCDHGLDYASWSENNKTASTATTTASSTTYGVWLHLEVRPRREGWRRSVFPWVIARTGQQKKARLYRGRHG